MQRWCRRLRGRATVRGRRPVLKVSPYLIRMHHALCQLVLPVGNLVIFPLVLALVGVELSAGVEDIVAVVPDAVDVVDGLGEPAGVEPALVVLHELFEAILVQLFVFHVEVLVLLHVGLVFEREVAPAPVAVEVGRLLVTEGTVGCGAVFLSAEPRK